MPLDIPDEQIGGEYIYQNDMTGEISKDTSAIIRTTLKPFCNILDIIPFL
jgi:hypothetical protein